MTTTATIPTAKPTPAENPNQDSGNSPPKQNTFEQIATGMTRYGIPVIPIPPKEKAAKLPNWPKLATTDLDQIRRWNAENHRYNCGAVAKLYGHWMMDCDTPGLPEIIERETGQTLPRTFATTSAKGLHLYFQQTDASRRMGNRKVAGVFDAQVDNKYVVAPGSIHPSGVHYEIKNDCEIVEAPDWLVDWIIRKSQADRAATAVSIEQGEKVGEGHRDDYLFEQACKLRDAKLSKSAALGALKEINREHCDPPLPERAVREKVESAFSRPARSAVHLVDNNARVLDKTESKPAYKYPARPWRTFQYVLGPTDSNTTPGLFSRSKSRPDGWFSRGQVNIIAGSSGAGKTRWMLPTLLEASRRGTVHGHPGQGLRFAVLFADRGPIGNQETIESLGLDPQALDIRHMPVLWGKAATDFIQHELERNGPDQMPDVLFVEGADTLVEDPNKAQVVAPFLALLGELAAHYNAAIILSLGAGKKSNEALTSRDRAFGSIMWQRMSAQMFILTRPAEDSEDRKRTMTINYRNWRPETIDLKFDEGGRLIEYKEEQKEEAAMTKSKQALLSFIEEHKGETFTTKQARDASGMNGSDVKSALSGYVAIGRLKIRTKGGRVSYEVLP